ncbi:MAG: helix-turn-helix transcriptional regulator [Gammaproteobacteria bacterium]|nr:helix-turn-helix transcriptional regulator [Gammaproteobacteria bacterium]
MKRDPFPRLEEERLDIGKLKQRMDKLGVTIATLADQSGVGARTITRWLGGQQYAKTTLIRAVEGALKLEDGGLSTTAEIHSLEAFRDWTGKYPDLRGEWELDVQYNSRIYTETLQIARQTIDEHGNCVIHGVLYTPHPTDPHQLIEQSLSGTFEDKFHVLYQFRCWEYTECGSGVLEIKTDHQAMRGMSVVYGFTSKNATELTIACFTAKKRPPLPQRSLSG